MRSGRHLVSAVAVCRERLADIEKRLANVDHDADALPIMADVDRALQALAVSNGLERRGAVMRLRAITNPKDA